MQNQKTLLPACIALVLLLGLIVPSAQAALLTWSNGGGDFGWSTTSTALNWSGAAWSDGNDAMFGSAGVGPITLNSPVAANSLNFTTSGYTITGGNTLVTNSGGITANASATISTPITLAANQTWAATGSSSVTTLTVSDPISGAGGITFGTTALTQSSSQFLTTTPTQIFANTQLSSGAIPFCSREC